VVNRHKLVLPVQYLAWYWTHNRILSNLHRTVSVGYVPCSPLRDQADISFRYAEMQWPA